VTGGADGTGNVTVRGSLADLNAALDGLVYQGDGDFNGPDTIQIDANDPGNNGAGGEQTDSKTIDVTVNPAENFNGTPGNLTVHAIDDSGSRILTTGPGDRKTLDTTAGDSDVDPAGNALQTSITAVNDSAETAVDQNLVIDENGTGLVDNAVLEITHVESTPDQIEYEITAATLDEGTLYLDANDNDTLDGGEELGLTDTFMQQDMNDGDLQYTHQEDITGASSPSPTT
jgi:hypothetical protein